ncbi:S41 family peptidase [Streptomyces nigrescens]
MEIDRAIRARLAAGEYDALDGTALCAAVTAHLQEVCPDKHLRVLWQDEPQSTEPEDDDAGRAAFLALLREQNQGIRRVEQLDGNIGCLDRPVYVLTSATTFSGGEDVAYTLQAFGRAELVGETPRGGAHPTDRHPVTEHITVTVPTARTTNAVTGTNWEGVGVRPGRAVAAGKALEIAHQEAIGRLS